MDSLRIERFTPATACRTRCAISGSGSTVSSATRSSPCWRSRSNAKGSASTKRSVSAPCREGRACGCRRRMRRWHWRGAKPPRPRLPTPLAAAAISSATARGTRLVDVLISVARGDLSRAWAWRQLGLWSAAADLAGAAPVEEALHVLAREAEAAAGVLAEVARAGVLEPLLGSAPEWAWSRVARAALLALGVPAAFGDRMADARAGDATSSPADVALHTARCARRSEILRAAVGAAALSRATARSLAILAVLEVEPALLRDGARADCILRSVEERLATAALSERRPVAANTGEPGSTRLIEAASREAAAGGGGSAAVETATKPEVRCRGTTRAGGLLLLLNLVDALDLPGRIAGDVALGGRSLRWVLHRLASRLTPVEARDPAALAFAGLRPTDEPPQDATDAGELEPERIALDGLRADIVAALRHRLRRAADSDERLLAFVCVRPAEVVADPGWIEVRFSLDDVSTEIRRAGLDLDPGWLPFLGVVMRFVHA